MEITYEVLFEALMLEKNRPDLQALGKDFFKALNTYINDKKKILEDKKGTLNIFSEAEKKKTSKQLTNVMKIVKELYERREKKIIEMALTRSRTGSAIMDTSALLEEETVFFNETIDLLDKHRDKTFSMIEAREKGFEEPKLPVKEYVGKKEEKEIGLKEKEEGKEVKEEDKEVKEEEKDAEKKENNTKNSNTTKVIRFIHAVPKFLGKQLEIYGPFEEEDISTLPSELADVLIRKGRAEQIQQ